MLERRREEVPGLSFKAKASEGQITALIQCLSDTGADPVIQPAPTQERPTARSRAQTPAAGLSCVAASLPCVFRGERRHAFMHLCMHRWSEREQLRRGGMRARSWAENQTANQRQAQKLPDLPAPSWIWRRGREGGGGGSSLWLESLILNNLAVVFAPQCQRAGAGCEHHSHAAHSLRQQPCSHGASHLGTSDSCASVAHPSFFARPSFFFLNLI